MVNPVYLCPVNSKMMDTLHQTQQIYPGLPEKQTEPDGRLNAVHPLTLQSARTYLLDALVEGLKQALLGSDINIEFFALSVRSYLIRLNRFSVSYPKRIISDNKPEKTNLLRNISNVRIFNNPLKLNLQ